MEQGNNTCPAFDILYAALKDKRFETGFDCCEFGKLVKAHWWWYQYRNELGFLLATALLLLSSGCVTHLYGRSIDEDLHQPVLSAAKGCHARFPLRSNAGFSIPTVHLCCADVTIQSHGWCNKILDQNPTSHTRPGELIPVLPFSSFLQ